MLLVDIISAGGLPASVIEPIVLVIEGDEEYVLSYEFVGRVVIDALDIDDSIAYICFSIRSSLFRSSFSRRNRSISETCSEVRETRPLSRFLRCSFLRRPVRL